MSSFLFEVIRDQKRDLRRGQRDLDRELLALNRQEQQTIADIKKLAAKGQNAAVKTLAKELVRIRSQKEKIYGTKSTLNSLVSANQTMAHAMAGATKSMTVANTAIPAQQMTRVMTEYAKQSDLMEQKQSMIEDVTAEPELDGEADDVVNQVLDEIGLDVGTKLAAAPVAAPASKTKVTANEDADLDAMIAKLTAT